MKKQFDNYHELKDQIDLLTEKLSDTHKNHMVCKKGCDLCCMDYNVFPVEYNSIKMKIENEPIDFQESTDGSCIFLKDHACQIYEHRPIICRTHGLPLLFMNEEQWELSACELNFTDFDDEDFSAKNTFPQDKFNSELFIVNKNYIKENNLLHSEFDLIPLNKLRD
ncbi:YkgJ family cysteine cluster protein [Sunxiuqinia indica]|uniref:YkgJ family cysteine cluster protein n=1 Tax=Sunxiuqinia indica TaxID=2692584 RepID=UPI00135A1B12|nr:YkgJ family cysteine cluster protein [Sunxiuqinia indica]